MTKNSLKLYFLLLSYNKLMMKRTLKVQSLLLVCSLLQPCPLYGRHYNSFHYFFHNNEVLIDYYYFIN